MTFLVGAIVRVRRGVYCDTPDDIEEFLPEPMVLDRGRRIVALPTRCPECAGELRVVGFTDDGRVATEPLDDEIRAVRPLFREAPEHLESLHIHDLVTP